MLIGLIEPYYPKAGRGRQPLGLEKMLRIYLLQLWFDLSDPQAEDAIYDSESMRRFAGVELSDDMVPDETTILRFRHLLEPNIARHMTVCIGLRRCRASMASFGRDHPVDFQALATASAASSGESCSQKRKTIHPARRNARVAARSRRRLRSIFDRQKSALVSGSERCRRHPCQ